MLKNGVWYGVWYNGAELDCNNHISGIFSAEPFLKGGRGWGSDSCNSLKQVIIMDNQGTL